MIKEKEEIRIMSEKDIEIIADRIVVDIFDDPKSHKANVFKLEITQNKLKDFNIKPLPGCLKGPDNYIHRYQHCPYCNWINCYDCHGMKPTPKCKNYPDLSFLSPKSK